jgi:1-acyl-sn-glycerol-3-phosphate acyltransferase
MSLLRASLFGLGYILSILVFAVPSVLTFPFPFELRYRFISQWSRFALWWLKVTCNLTYEVKGRENIPQQNAIILCKHQSAWETLALQHIFPPQVWLLKRELLWIPFFGWGLAMLEPIAIDRKAGRRAMRQVIEQGRERLQAGRWVVIFPEGTRVPPGKKRRYRLGGAKLAEKTGYPVVPVAHNAGFFWPRRGFLKKPGVITLEVGPPIDSAGMRAEDINAAAEEWIESRMTAITGVAATLIESPDTESPGQKT